MSNQNSESNGAPRRRRLIRGIVASRIGFAGLVLTGAAITVAILANLIAAYEPLRSAGRALSPPSWTHLMGTDDLGRDILSGVVHGARTSLLIMTIAVGMTSVIGLSVGAIAAFRGGLVDDALMRVTEVFQALPRFFLAILVVALFGSGVGLIALVLGLTSWTRIARVVRAEILSLKSHDFVEAARAVGMRERWVLLRHILPNALPSAVVVIALMGANVILIEASLSFLGLGAPGAISWGTMIRNGGSFLRSAWWMTTFPGIAMVATTVGINLLADALNDALDPLREQRALGRSRTDRSARRPVEPILLGLHEEAVTSDPVHEEQTKDSASADVPTRVLS